MKAILAVVTVQTGHREFVIGFAALPVTDVLICELDAQAWSTRTHDALRSMDHRGLVEIDGNWLTVGGMLENQQVTDRVVACVIDCQVFRSASLISSICGLSFGGALPRQCLSRGQFELR